jgi:hypothetical protein
MWLGAIVPAAIIASCKLIVLPDISWVWVLSPFWIPLVEGIVIGLIDWAMSDDDPRDFHSS